MGLPDSITAAELRRDALGSHDGRLSALVYVGDQLARIADALDELAPPIRNGAGEVVGRTVNVAAAIRADFAEKAPAGVEGAAALHGKERRGA